MHETKYPTATSKAYALEQRQIDWTQTSAEAKACLGNTNALQIERQLRGLALFNLAIDSKLRGCDLVCNQGRRSGS